MAQSLHAAPSSQRNTAPGASVFGIPVGEFGWFGTLLVGVASGFLTFFAATFVSIVVILFSNSLAHTNIDYAASYRWVGFPLGVAVLVVALGYLGTLWVRRMLRKG